MNKLKAIPPPPLSPYFTKLLFKDLWGDVEQPFWITFTVSGVVLPAWDRVQITTRFQIQKHRRIVAEHIQCVQGRTGGSNVTLPSQNVVLDAHFVHLLQESLKDSIEDISLLLYEFDPRIGYILLYPKDSLPVCPLFDRRGPVWRPKWKDWTARVAQGAHSVAAGVPVEQVPCMLCGEDFEFHMTPMWGGGNIGWVHANCWIELASRQGGLDPLARA